MGRGIHRVHPRLVEPDGLRHELALPGHHIAEDSGLRQGEKLCVRVGGCDDISYARQPYCVLGLVGILL